VETADAISWSRLEKDWTAAFGAISRLMQAGASEV
jgi:hypothetical protein